MVTSGDNVSKLAEVNPTVRMTADPSVPRGDEVHIPLLYNPYNADPQAAAEYENGYEYAQSIGHLQLDGVTPEDLQRWSTTAVPWREGFKDALGKLGRGDLAEKIAARKKIIAVDFDGTLATTVSHNPYNPEHLGNPVGPMVDRVKGWLADGHDVHVFTARAHTDGTNDNAAKATAAIQSWCKEHIGRELPVTAHKAPHFDEFWDDRARRVERDTGKAAQFAPGISDKNEKGDLNQLPTGLHDYFVQHHVAEKAGPHYDIRFGSPDIGLFSWAARKGLPPPGETHLAIRQPLHEHEYGPFEGTIEEGYGKGEVSLHDQGRALVTQAGPDHVEFVVAHRKAPESYRMVQINEDKDHWLVTNTTPVDPLEVDKPHYRSANVEELTDVPADKVMATEKIDGASAIIAFGKKGADVFSYRTSVTGRPIVHTHRVSETGLKMPVPKEWQGKLLRGELYGVRDGKAIPASELGGILNSALAKSLETQKSTGVKLRVALFNTIGNDDEPYPKRWDKMQEALKFLPGDIFHLPRAARTPEEIKDLWEDTVGGRNPRTSEGIVVQPLDPSQKVLKVKKRPDFDVFIRKIFPGAGKFEGTHAGGFEYSHTPTGPVVGRVGTGFDDSDRRSMWTEPGDWLGRRVRVNAMGTHASGALREPSFIARHEDYDEGLKVAELRMQPQPHQKRVAERLRGSPGLLAYHGLGSGKTLTAINAAHELGLPLLAIVPASLKYNMEKEIAAAGFKHPVMILSHQEAMNRLNDPDFRAFAGKALVAYDEGHRLGRVDSARSRLAAEVPAAKKLFLTGTPIRNEPSELAPLLNAISPGSFPETATGFNQRYVERQKVPVGFWGQLRGAKPGVTHVPINMDSFRKAVGDKVDFYQAVDRSAYPSFSEETVDVPMSRRQQATYDFVLGKYPALLYKIRHGIPMGVTERRNFLAFLNAPRRITNHPGEFNASATDADATKIQQAAQEVVAHHAQDPNYRGVTYSAFLASGVHPMSRALTSAGIPHATFTGEMQQKDRKQMVQDYNTGKIKHLLISGAGAEGLDLKGTKLMQILEPHWNEELINQVKGRAIRYHSHSHLPSDERHVEIQRFHAIPQKTMVDRMLGRPRSSLKSADEYIYETAQEKRKLNQPFLQALEGTEAGKAASLFCSWGAWEVTDG